MRITGGTLRGRTLKTPTDRSVRPTSDKVRQALFNILGERIVEARVLDLFAGSGSLGLEALSRAAAHATFVEKGHRALKVIHENVEVLGVTDRATVRRLNFIARPERLRDPVGSFDVVFLDPPYRMSDRIGPDSKLGRLLEAVWRLGVAGEGALVVLEHRKRAKIAEDWRNFQISDVRSYGDTSLTFLESRESQ